MNRNRRKPPVDKQEYYVPIPKDRWLAIVVAVVVVVLLSINN